MHKLHIWQLLDVKMIASVHIQVSSKNNPNQAIPRNCKSNSYLLTRIGDGACEDGRCCEIFAGNGINNVKKTKGFGTGNVVHFIRECCRLIRLISAYYDMSFTLQKNRQ